MPLDKTADNLGEPANGSHQDRERGADFQELLAILSQKQSATRELIQRLRIFEDRFATAEALMRSRNAARIKKLENAARDRDSSLTTLTYPHRKLKMKYARELEVRIRVQDGGHITASELELIEKRAEVTDRETSSFESAMQSAKYELGTWIKDITLPEIRAFLNLFDALDFDSK